MLASFISLTLYIALKITSPRIARGRGWERCYIPRIKLLWDKLVLVKIPFVYDLEVHWQKSSSRKNPTVNSFLLLQMNILDITVWNLLCCGNPSTMVLC